MKRFFLFLTMLVAIMAMASVAAAGPAYTASFTTSITYQNLGDATANVVFAFYPENSATPVTVNRSLAANAGGSLFVGSVDDIAAGFVGSAVLSSDQPVVATLVQISSDSDVKNRPLSNGFAQGSNEVLLATVLKNKFSSTSQFAVQNAHSTSVDLTLRIFNADNPSATPTTITHANLPQGAAKLFDMGKLSQISADVFNGSATVTAVESGTSNPANIAATVLELSTNSGASSSFEGISGGADTVYMPSALCKRFGSTTAYAVQNTGDSATTVTVTYSNGVTDSASINPGAKKSFNGCNVLAEGTIGAATITSSNGDIVAVGKVFEGGISSAFLGADSGAETLALPYVRYSTSQFSTGQRQRAFIAIQNVGSPLANGSVVAKYLDKNGDLVATHTLGAMATGQKLNTNAGNSALVLAAGKSQADLNEFGYVGGFGGSILVEGPAGSELVAVVRIISQVGSSQVGEDYNGIPVNQ